MKLPVVSTRGLIVFPGHTMTLDVGRQSSLNALQISAVNHDYQLVLVSQKDLMKDEIKSKDEIYSVGTLVSYKVERDFPNGAKTISVYGLQRVKLTKVQTYEGKMIEADCKVIKPIEAASEAEERAYVNKISKTLDKAIGAMINVPKNVLSSLASGISASDLADVVGHYLPLSLAKKQKMLETIDVAKRLELVNEYLIEESEISEIEKGIDNNVKKTIDSQHKEFLLRERLKAIKEELGEISSKDSEIDKWKEMLEDKKYPEHVKEAIKDEIRKFESTPPMAAESNVIKGYIEWTLALPWNTYSKDNNDLDAAKNTLDKHHYGLKKVKERIVEHLAVKMNTKSSTSPIITLVGPPGVGKTSLAKSIAEAVDRQFVKVSLGGVKDEAEIRGHRRTYVGAMPGKIIQAFKKAKTSNPLILLDEIDKMSSDYKGDPTSAMLEVLDPEQNKFFQDHFLELEYDLSNVMFLATANYYEQIPSPLLDRVELIFLDQYTSEEKLAIAKNYIIPKVIKENGLTKGMFKVTDKTLEYIIDKYTQEAGVRGLQRIMGKLARKIVVLKLEKKIKSAYTITEAKARELLGKEQVYKEVLKGKAEVGLVNGMYYSAVGGGVLPIEISIYKSKDGGLKVTGSLKDVMKESLNIALGYIRSHEKEFGIKFEWETNTIQVHVPEGAIPKDGPSAGIAFATALISALTGKPVPRDIALTGEITLRGKVLPIGGLKEKTIGAVEAGIKRIFIPKVNERDYDELATKVKENATIIPAEDYKEVFKYIFKK